MSKLYRNFMEKLDSVKNMKENNTEYSSILDSIENIMNKKHTINDVAVLIEAISMCEKNAPYVKNEFAIMDYTEFVDYIISKPRKEQVEFVETIKSYLFQFYIWEIDFNHCLIKIDLIDKEAA